MPKKKKVSKNEENKPQNIKPGVSIDIYFSIRGIKEHKRPGMKAYKGASEMVMTMPEWDEFFSSY